MQPFAPESALAVLVPETEGLVGAFRELHDPSAAVGIPAHITVLYPFKPPREITTATIESLEEIFSEVNQFDVCFGEWRTLRQVLCLAPVPDEPLRRMTEKVYARFPETPPYEGQFAEIIPHLTVAQDDNPDRLREVTGEFDRAAKGVLPIHARIAEVVLLENETGRWKVRHRFALA
jgi:2'-5' RNA ligase